MRSSSRGCSSNTARRRSSRSRRRAGDHRGAPRRLARRGEAAAAGRGRARQGLLVGAVGASAAPAAGPQPARARAQGLRPARAPFGSRRREEYAFRTCLCATSPTGRSHEPGGREAPSGRRGSSGSAGPRTTPSARASLPRGPSAPPSFRPGTGAGVARARPVRRPRCRRPRVGARGISLSSASVRGGARALASGRRSPSGAATGLRPQPRRRRSPRRKRARGGCARSPSARESTGRS